MRILDPGPGPGPGPVGQDLASRDSLALPCQAPQSRVAYEGGHVWACLEEGCREVCISTGRKKVKEGRYIYVIPFQ